MNKDLEQLIAALRRSQQLHTGAWAQVIDSARQYAQMKTHGAYLENSTVKHVARSDQESYEKMFRDQLLRQVEQAFLEDALFGASVQQTLSEVKS